MKETDDSIGTLLKFITMNLPLTLQDVIAMPEQDDWQYNSYNGRPVITPASFVVGALRAYGVFGNTEINAAEFTVTDVYQLAIFESNPKLPEQCVAADPDLPYC